MDDKDDKGNIFVTKETIARHNLTEKQARMVGLITLWITLAGLWQTVETAWVILAWVFR